MLIAGLGSDSVSWLPVIINLSKNFRVITFDNRGVGRSSLDNSNITIEDMADDCVELINHLGLPSVNLLGHSMGGMIAMNIAIRYPELVDKLILAATTPVISNRNIHLLNDWVLFLKSRMDKHLWFKNMFYWIFSPKFFEDEMLFNQAVTMAVNYRYPQSDISFENQVKAIIAFNCLPSINEIKTNTLVINGEQDILFPSIETKDGFADIQNCNTKIISNAAHSIHMDNPVDFIETVVDFLHE
ncbi:MAG: alpha/beta hydrolase [Bacteroidetes bacterium]|nr:alpha/beta hydrolase [Bacteroidota bacterium]